MGTRCFFEFTPAVVILELLMDSEFGDVHRSEQASE